MKGKEPTLRSRMSKTSRSMLKVIRYKKTSSLATWPVVCLLVIVFLCSCSQAEEKNIYLFRVHVKLRASSLLVFWLTFSCFCRLKRLRREWFLFHVLPLIYFKHFCILPLPFLLENGREARHRLTVYIFLKLQPYLQFIAPRYQYNV